MGHERLKGKRKFKKNYLFYNKFFFFIKASSVCMYFGRIEGREEEGKEGREKERI